MNVGTGVHIRIGDPAELVRLMVYPTAELVYDDTKPDGTPRKLLDLTLCRVSDGTPARRPKWASARPLPGSLSTGSDLAPGFVPPCVMRAFASRTGAALKTSEQGSVCV